MNKNLLKEKLNAGQATLGPFVGFPSPAITETMGWLGFDFVIIDCEHGPIDYETAENMIRAAELSNTTPLVRIGLNEQQHIQRYLEAGAQGVLIPLVNNAADAMKVVNSVKYPPLGKRGSFSGRSAHFGVGAGPEYFTTANEEIFVAIQIETPEAIENADEIIATSGVDAVFLGPGDLSLNFGIPGQMEHEKVVTTIEALVKKIIAAGMHPGTLGNHPAHAKFWHERGVNWLVSSATRHLIAGGSDYLDGTRKALGI
jgi:4-hydroxy-2-oxoheptanedioate aldolase